MPTSASPVRGRSSSWILAAIAVALTLVVALVLLVRRERELTTTPSAAAPTASAADGTATDPDLSLSQPRERAPGGFAGELARPGGIAIPAGVRLPGPGKLSGRVLDRERGQGVAGARVDLLPLPGAGTHLVGRILRLAKNGDAVPESVEPIAVTGTDAGGAFAFEGVRPGTYFLEARSSTCVPDGPARARVLASGNGGPLELFVRAGGRIVGTVLRPDGRPAAGAEVHVSPGRGSFLESARRGDLTFLETTADEHGEFVAHGVPAWNEYELTVTSPSFAITHVGGVAVRAGEDTLVEVRGRVGATIRGRLLSAASSEDEKGRPTPLAGGHLAVIPRGLLELSFLEEILEATHTQSGADGSYEIRNVPAGELDVVAIAAGHLGAKGPRLWTSDGATTTVADFELARGPIVSGRVVDLAGAPIEGVSVTWNPIDAAEMQEFDFTFAPFLVQAVKGFEFPKTDADGRFSAGPFPGEPTYEIKFWKAGYAQATQRWDPSKESGELEVVLHAGGRIEGIVMDALKHAPVGSFTVSSESLLEETAGASSNENPFSSGQLFEGPDGRFALASVEAGDVVLDFRAPGFLPSSQKLAVIEGEILRGVIVELSPGGRLRGRVVDPDGAPVAGAQVFAASENGHLSGAGNGDADDMPPGLRDFAAALGLLGDRAVLSLADGSFVLDGLDAGTAIVHAVHRDFIVGSSSLVTVIAGTETTGVEIELSRGGGVFGRALDRFERPIEGGTVFAMSPASMGGEMRSVGGALYQARTDAQGRYEIAPMAAGNYFLVLTRGDETMNPMSFLGTLSFDLVTVPADEKVEFDLVDTSVGGTHVLGRIVARGASVTGGNVIAMGLESESMLGLDVKIAQVKPDGSFEFAGLAPGEYRFQLEDLQAGGDGFSADVSAEIPDVPEHSLELHVPDAVLEGRVVDAESSAPLARVEVRLAPRDRAEPQGLLGKMLSQENGVERESTGDDGVFRFEHLQSGDYALTAHPYGSAERGAHAPSDPIEIHVRDGETRAGFEVRLDPALALEGHVKNGEGEPLVGVDVLATRTDREVAGADTATSGEDGSFRLALAPGTYDLSASLDGFADARVEHVLVERAKTGAVEIEMSRGITVRVRVLSAAGQPISGATGRLVAKGGAPGADAGDFGHALENLFAGKGVSDKKGMLELGNFAPGEYVLEVQRGFARAEPQDVKLGGEREVELRARLR